MIRPVMQKCNAFGNNSTMELGVIKTVLAEELMPTCNAMYNNQWKDLITVNKLISKSMNMHSLFFFQFQEKILITNLIIVMCICNIYVYSN